MRMRAMLGRGCVTMALIVSTACSDGDGTADEAQDVDADVMRGDEDAALPSVEDASHPDAARPDAELESDASVDAGGSTVLPYASAVQRFTPGSNAGYNSSKLPGIVLGPPKGIGTSGGSLDVLSLGVGGEIVLDFAPLRIVDGEGDDFVVFENPFWPSGDASKVFAELGEVSVSDDAQTWHTFTCDPKGSGGGKFPGCAGWSPTLEFAANEVVPLDVRKTGGDGFDLAELGLRSARYVRVRDLATEGAGMTGGFDLDAIGAIHFQ